MTGNALLPAHLLLAAAVGCLVFLIPAIFYLLTLQKALARCSAQSRTMQPGMVWLLLIPIFSLIWHFFVVFAIAKSLASEFARRGIPSPEPLPGQNIGLGLCVCLCCGIIPVLGILASLAGLVLWVVYWIKIANYSAMIAMPMAPAMAPPINY